MPLEKGIVYYDTPQEVDFGNWLLSHPDCDTIFDKTATFERIIVLAYATDEQYNDRLAEIRDERYSDKFILKGLSRDGVNSIRKCA